MKVIVLGSGITGTAAAWFLRQAGHDVTVIERRPALRRKPLSETAPRFPFPFGALGKPFCPVENPEMAGQGRCPSSLSFSCRTIAVGMGCPLSAGMFPETHGTQYAPVRCHVGFQQENTPCLAGRDKAGLYPFKPRHHALLYRQGRL